MYLGWEVPSTLSELFITRLYFITTSDDQLKQILLQKVIIIRCNKRFKKWWHHLSVPNPLFTNLLVPWLGPNYQYAFTQTKLHKANCRKEYQPSSVRVTRSPTTMPQRLHPASTHRLLNLKLPKDSGNVSIFFVWYPNFSLPNCFTNQNASCWKIK